MSIKYCISFIFIVSLFSCKERIDIALAEDVNKLIIEGEVHDGAGPYYVKLSRSTKFGSSTTFYLIRLIQLLSPIMRVTKIL